LIRAYYEHLKVMFKHDSMVPFREYRYVLT